MAKTTAKPKGKKGKSPATPEKGFKVIEEGEFMTVYEFISPGNSLLQWWCIECKLYAAMPVKHVIRLKVNHIFTEWGKDGNELVEIRTYFPKNHYELDDVKKMAASDETAYQKEFAKMKKFEKFKG